MAGAGRLVSVNVSQYLDVWRLGAEGMPSRSDSPPCPSHPLPCPRGITHLLTPHPLALPPRSQGGGHYEQGQQLRAIHQFIRHRPRLPAACMFLTCMGLAGTLTLLSEYVDWYSYACPSPCPHLALRVRGLVFIRLPIPLPACLQTCSPTCLPVCLTDLPARYIYLGEAGRLLLPSLLLSSG